MSEVDDRWREAWDQKFGVGGTHAHRGLGARSRPEPLDSVDPDEKDDSERIARYGCRRSDPDKLQPCRCAACDTDRADQEYEDSQDTTLGGDR